MLKAAAGGGGRGIRKVTNPAELEEVFDRTQAEALRAFGNETVFLERLVTGARHVEVQIIADGQGTAWALGVRDCSIQRRNQKVIEESASAVLDAAQEAELKASAERLALTVGYRGAATVEFLYHPGERTFAFLEVNTRLQVEHPITELVTGVDLVALQLHVAAGGRLEGEPPVAKGHAVEARLNAEDPDRDFAPAPGRIARLRFPVGPGIRVDTGFAEGDVIPADFDSMIAKVIGYGRTREEAFARLRRAVTDTVVVIDGGITNKTFLLELADAPAVIDGSADTGWIDRERAAGGLSTGRDAGLALVAAAIDAYEEEEQLERLRFLQTAHGGRPQARPEVGREFDLRVRGTARRVSVAEVGLGRYRVGVDGVELDAVLELVDGYSGRLTVGARTARVVAAAHGADHLVEVDGAVFRVTRDEGGVIRAPAPALVVAVNVVAGQEVEAGSAVVVCESMKMETVLPAPVTGRVREVLVAAGVQVEAGTPLVRLEPSADASVVDVPATPLELPDGRAADAPVPLALRCLDDLRSVLLGFDLGPEDGRGCLERYLTVREQLGAGLEQADAMRLLEAELEALSAFADLCELTRNTPAAEDLPDERVHSPREHFHTYLHSLDADREHLPEEFRVKLRRALAHYGVTELERSPQLEEAVHRIFLGQQRTRAHLGLVTAVLERWLDEQPPPDGPLAEAAREALDRLVVATQLRYPAVGDVARSARYTWFDQPIAQAFRDQAYADVRGWLAHLRSEPDAADYDRTVEELVDSPEALMPFLAERIAEGIPAREPMLEVLARRYYRDHSLEELLAIGAGEPLAGAGPAGAEIVADRAWVLARYEVDGRSTRALSTLARLDELPALAPTLDRLVADTPSGQQVVVDLFVVWPQLPTDADEAARQIGELLEAQPFVPRTRRTFVAAVDAGGQRVFQTTFRPKEEGLAEDRLVRGLHPMVARRLDLWRLRDFEITRLPSTDDVLLYRCVAPANPSDQRLVALAQVRELTVVRDAAGRVTSLPPVERTIASCLDSIRRARSEIGPRARLDMNHVFLYVWAPVEAPLEELTSLQRTIAPLTGGAGLTETLVQGRVVIPGQGPVPVAIRFTRRSGSGVVAQVGPPPRKRLEPLDEYAQKVLRSRQRGTVYPYELVPQLAGEGGTFTEYDLDAAGQLVPVQRAPGRNASGMVVGLARTPTARYPDGMTRVVLLGDPTKSLGALAEAECARVCAALDLAERLRVPVEWFALSSGARISMDSGTENMDWVARALRRIITFTQAGGEINVIVSGINVGAQPYWNAEATMLMHTKGILVMTPDSAMVLTGKQALDYSGGVSAEDNFGIGGFDRVMGPNGQAQYWAHDLDAAIDTLFGHYEHAYVAPGERFPRPALTTDAAGPGRPHRPARAGRQRVPHHRRRVLRDREPGAQEGVRHPLPDAGGGRRRPHPARALGRDGGRRDVGGAGRAPRRPPGLPDRGRVPPDPPPRLPAQRRPGQLDRRHPVPAVVEEDRPGDQRRQRQPPGGGAGQPVRLRRLPGVDAHACSWSTAPRSAARW